MLILGVFFPMPFLLIISHAFVFLFPSPQIKHSYLPNEHTITLNSLLPESQFCLGIGWAYVPEKAYHFPSTRT